MYHSLPGKRLAWVIYGLMELKELEMEIGNGSKSQKLKITYSIA